MTKPAWTLASAVEMAREHPYTFYKPSHVLIDILRPGDLVKLIFELEAPGPEDPESERMQVQITARDDDNFTGILTNQPFAIMGLNQKDRMVPLLDRKAPVAFEWQDKAGGFVETDMRGEV